MSVPTGVLVAGKMPIYALILLSALALGAGWAALALWWGPAGLILAVALWLIGEIRGWRWSSYTGLFLLVILAAVGLALDMPPLWAILGVVLALAGWEMSHFRRFLARANVIDNEEILIQRHWRRLMVISLLGALLAGLAVTIQFSLSFGVALLLAVLALVGLGRAMHFLRQESQS